MIKGGAVKVERPKGAPPTGASESPKGDRESRSSIRASMRKKFLAMKSEHEKMEVHFRPLLLLFARHFTTPPFLSVPGSH
jgi:hypothetical protein